MKCKVIVSKLSNIINNLNKIAEREDIPIKSSFKISRLLNLLSIEAERYDESRFKIINKYGKKDEQGELIVNKDNNTISIQEDKLDVLNKEINDLNSIEITIEFDPISINDFGDINIAPKYLIDLNVFIIEK